MTFSLSTNNASMVGLFIEAIFYGIYLVTFGQTMVCILRSPTGRGWKVPQGVRLLTLIVALALCLNSTLNLFFGLVRKLQMYIFDQNEPANYWINLAQVGG